jgi:polyisoprenoid-binding protein YceI
MGRLLLLAMTRAGALAIATLAAIVPAAARSGEVYRVDPEKTSVGFEVSQLGLFTQSGRFGHAHGRIIYDADTESGSVDLTVETATVNTGWELRDTFVRGEDMLDAARYPKLEFRSTAMSFAGHRLVAVDGELTLRGVTRPVRLEVRNVQCGAAAGEGGERCSAEIVGRISRHDFGIDYAYPLVGDEVLLTFAVSALRQRDTEAKR